MLQFQTEQYRDAAEETTRNDDLKRRMFGPGIDSVEGEPYTSSPIRKPLNLNQMPVQHTAADLTDTMSSFQLDQFRNDPSSLQRQDHTNTRELGVSHIPEFPGSGMSARPLLGKFELQKNQNAVFFPSSSNFQVIDSNFTSFRDNIVSNVIINVNRPKHNESVRVRVPTGDGTEVRPEVSNIEITSSKQPLQIRKSSEIYYRHLLTLGHGSPLWIPEPSTSLPIEYQKTGIGIGDVGILKESGGFDFLFNVYQPCNDADHPINPRTIPDGFVPLCPPEERDVNSHVEFKNHSFLTSSQVNSRHDESSGFIFKSSAEDGAILTMPKGANSIDLENMGMVRKVVSKNVQQWYTYANDVRGRDARNGDLRLVIGKTSATTWGMATFSRESDEDTPSCLKFKPTRLGDSIGDRAASSPNYRWEYSGTLQAEVKSGPDEDEVKKLRKFDRCRGNRGQTAYENQCLFVRTINVTLQEGRRRPTDIVQPPLTNMEFSEDPRYHRESVALHPNPKFSQVAKQPEDGMGFSEQSEADYKPIFGSTVGEALPAKYYNPFLTRSSIPVPISEPPIPATGTPVTSSANFSLSQDSDNRHQAGPSKSLRPVPTHPLFYSPREVELKMIPSAAASGRPFPFPTTGVQMNVEQSPRPANETSELDTKWSRPLKRPGGPRLPSGHPLSSPHTINDNINISFSGDPRAQSGPLKTPEQLRPMLSLSTLTITRPPNHPSEIRVDERPGLPGGLPSFRTKRATKLGDHGRPIDSSDSLSPFLLSPSRATCEGATKTLMRFGGVPSTPSSHGKSESHIASSGFPNLNFSPPLPGDLHPSKVINEYLLNTVPSATMAMTEDGDWISVLKESDTVFPADGVLLSRIKRLYKVNFEEGVVFLLRRKQEEER